MVSEPRSRVVRLKDDGAGPGPQSTAASLEKELGTAFTVQRTEHFIVALCDGSSNPASSPLVAWLGKLLEATYSNFFALFAGLTQLSSAKDLVVIAYTSPRDFWRHANRRGSHPYLHSQHSGYYCPASNRMVLLLEELHHLPCPRQLAELEEIRRCSVAHEAAHLLSFNCGLLQQGFRYPWWVVEGIAVGFEAAPPGDLPFSSPSCLSPIVSHLRTLHDARSLLPLASFLALSRPPKSRMQGTSLDTWRLMYCQGWGLFAYLFQDRPNDLAAFLENLRDHADLRWPTCFPSLPKRRRLRRGHCLELARQSFGDLVAMEKGWMEFLRSMGMTRSPIAEKGNNRGKARATHSPGYEAALSEAMALPGEPSQDTCLEPLHPDVA